MSQEKLQNSFKLEMKELNDINNDKLFCGSFKAYFSTYGTVNYRPDRMVKGCFDKEIARFRNGDKLPRLLAQHNGSQVIGKILSISDDDKGAIVEAKFSNTQMGRDYYTLFKSGAIDELSFAFYVTNFNYDEDSVRNVLEVSGIDEISIVTWGMDPKTEPIEVNRKELTIRHAEQLLRNGGFSQDQAKTILSKGFNAMDRDDSERNRDDLELMLMLSNLNQKLRS